MNPSRLATLALFACSLAGSAFAQGGQVAVVVLSDPPGASLLAADGRTVVASLPLTKTYTTPTPWRACVSYPGFTVRWSNGAEVKIGRIDLCPEDGGRQQIVVSVPLVPAPTPVPPPASQSTVVCRDGGIVYKPADGRCATPASASPKVSTAGNASNPPATVRETPTESSSASVPRQESGRTTLSVTMTQQRMNESTYQFMVPGTVNTYRAGSSNCYGQTNGTLYANVVGSTVIGTVNGASSATCSGSETSNTTVTPARSVSYTLQGATLALQLPDGRTAVVNCNSKLNWTEWSGGPRRSCRIPTVTQFDVEFSGDKAKLIWRVGINGEKVVSETYDLIQILDPLRR
jgi:hypothetical protein